MRARPRRSPAPPAPSGASLPRLRARWLWLIAGMTLAAHFGALATYFAQEDFLYLHRALHGDPTPFWTARFLSLSLWFRAIALPFGPNALAFHAASLVLIAGMGAIVSVVMARSVKEPLAVAAGVLVVTSAVLFVPARWAAANSDLLTALLLGGALLAIAPGASQWRRNAAPLLFVLALWSKEIAVGAAPVLAWLELRSDRPSRVRAGFYIVAAAAFALLAPWRMASYTTDWSAMPVNLARYVAAIVLGPAAAATFSEMQWAKQPWVAFAGGLLILAWIVALIRRRNPHAWFAAAWFGGLLAPVLPLTQQLYFYYAACAMPGLWCSLILLVAPRPDARAPRWLVPALAVVCAAQIAGVHMRERARMETAPLPVDFVLRRAAIARNAITDILPHIAELRSSVTFVTQQPVPSASGGNLTTEATDYKTDPYWDWSVSVALYDGLAVKLFAPQVHDVLFARFVGPEDSARTIVQCAIDGHARVTSYEGYANVPPYDSRDPVGSRKERAGRFIELRMFPEAARELQEAARLTPDDPTILINLGTLAAAFGDTIAARQAFERALQIAPGDLEVRFNLGLLHWRAGARAEARRVWQPVLDAAPESDLARQIRAALAGQAR